MKKRRLLIGFAGCFDWNLAIGGPAFWDRMVPNFYRAKSAYEETSMSKTDKTENKTVLSPDEIEKTNLKDVVRRENPVQEDYCTHIRANGECCLAAAAALAKAFVWAETEDGFEYWHYVWLTLTEIGEVASRMEQAKKGAEKPAKKAAKR